MITAPFEDLAYGAKFRYITNPDKPNDPVSERLKERIWVRIDYNTIAEWIEEYATVGFHQPICSFADYEDERLSTEVEYVK
jgi:hypothetical protein